MKVYQRALGERAATRCENATTPRCTCRCGGGLHGRGRVGGAFAERTVWELPRDDPHHPQAMGGVAVLQAPLPFVEEMAR